jgi:hypothetical protein
VILYAAEDALHIVRQRLEGICAAAAVPLAELDIQVITAPILRLDLDADRRNLDETIARLQPRLLVLDPFARLHRIDENASGEVAPLLAYLCELQRRYGVAVIVVHHAKKGAGRIRAGQALRGSSEFHVWGDSNLYLLRSSDPRGDALTLTVEHRAAPAMPTVALELAHRADALALEVIDRRGPQALPPSSVAFQRATSPNQNALSLAFRATEARRRHSSARRRKCSTLTCFLPTDCFRSVSSRTIAQSFECRWPKDLATLRFCVATSEGGLVFDRSSQ